MATKQEKEICPDCGGKIDRRAKRCNSCAAKVKHKEGVYQNSYFKVGNVLGVTFGFQKGHKMQVGSKHTEETKEKIRVSSTGRLHTEKTKEKLRTGFVKHHIWYEDSEGNLTDKGVMAATRKHHNEIHVVLNYNYWTDNRRYLAG